jgi:hypothetical protein
LVDTIYLWNLETFAPGNCDTNDTLLLNSLLGTDTLKDRWSVDYTPGYTDLDTSYYGLVMYISADKTTFGYGAGENLQWLLHGGPTGFTRN